MLSSPLFPWRVLCAVVRPSDARSSCLRRLFRPGRISRLPLLLLVLGWCGGACESTWEEDLHDILRAAAALFHFFFFLRVTSKYSDQSENSSATPSLETPRLSSLTTCVVQQTKWVWACVCVQDRLEVGMNGILARVCRSPFKRYGRYMSAEVNGSAYAAKSCAIWIEMSTSYRCSTPLIKKNVTAAGLCVIASKAVPPLRTLCNGPITLPRVRLSLPPDPPTVGP